MSHPEHSTTDALRIEFDQLVTDVRPALLRYCARITGSMVDGEDVVQDTLVNAYAALFDSGFSPSIITRCTKETPSSSLKVM